MEKIKKKQKIHAPAVKKCLNKIFGFTIPCRKCWVEMAEAFPQETFANKGEVQIFLRQYVWTHTLDPGRLAARFRNPFPSPIKKKSTKKKIPKRKYSKEDFLWCSEKKG